MATRALRLLKETWSRFGADNASLLAAAIAYSTVFAIAPLIVIAIAIAGEVVGLADGGHGHHVAENQIISTIGLGAGAQTAQLVRSLVDTSFASRQGSLIAQTAGWVTFALAASGLFLTLQSAINIVWRAKPRQHGIWLTLRNRLVSAAMLLLIGVGLLLTVCVDVALAFFTAHLATVLPFFGSPVAASAVSYLVDVVLIGLMFALVYKVLPDAHVSWRDVEVGAPVTALLFVAGEALLSLYLGRAGIANAYGAVGSLVVLLVWVYYSAMLFLFGAEFTRVYADLRTAPVAVAVPAPAA
ncbi:MAG TPA: YihY/virulence factor BrkB family protein [Candidatus Sulfotelmatobacter sp.]|nr:YihY/virulence factor BrkB family protein [Candidatus Sulfotelmatobacter sp.]